MADGTSLDNDHSVALSSAKHAEEDTTNGASRDEPPGFEPASSSAEHVEENTTNGASRDGSLRVEPAPLPAAHVEEYTTKEIEPDGPLSLDDAQSSLLQVEEGQAVGGAEEEEPAQTQVFNAEIAVAGNGVKKLSCGCNFDDVDGYINDLASFVTELNKALRDIKPNRIYYDRVNVLSVRWEDSDVEELSENAKKLEAVFRDEYGFNVDTYLLQNSSRSAGSRTSDEHQRKISRDFKRYLSNRMVEYDDDSDFKHNLTILYYTGHAAEYPPPPDTDGVTPEGVLEYHWQAKEDAASTKLKWLDIESTLYDAESDMLFIADCCFAGVMLGNNTKWSRRCELFCSSGPTEVTPVPTQTRKTRRQVVGTPSSGSFTSALADILSVRRDQAFGTDILLLYTKFTDSAFQRRNKLKLPMFRQKSNEQHPHSIVLRSLKSTRDDASDSAISDISTAKSLQAASDAYIIVRLHLRQPADPGLPSQWKQWLEGRPGVVDTMELEAVTKYALTGVDCHGHFPSASSVLLLSMPLWLWTLLPENAAYVSLATVRGRSVVAGWTSTVPSLKAEAQTQDQEVLDNMSSKWVRLNATHQARMHTGSADLLPGKPTVAWDPDVKSSNVKRDKSPVHLRMQRHDATTPQEHPYASLRATPLYSTTSKPPGRYDEILSRHAAQTGASHAHKGLFRKQVQSNVVKSTYMARGVPTDQIFAKLSGLRLESDLSDVNSMKVRYGMIKAAG